MTTTTRTIKVPFKTGTTAQNDAYKGNLGEITIDRTRRTLRVHDGIKTGGEELLRRQDITEVADQSAAAIQAMNDAVAARDSSRNWATQLTTEVVAGQGYSSRQYSLNSATSATLAQNWATSLVNTFTGAGGLYGARKYANDSSTSATLAQNWATSLTTFTNSGGLFGARKYANDAATAASNASTSESNASTSATNAATSKTGADTAKAAAEAAQALAQKWATQTTAEVVAGQGYGAKYYADQAYAYLQQAQAGQVLANWTETNTASKAFIQNKPVLAAVATSGSKNDVGLGNVENKSSATIRSELTSANVTTALGFTPINAATRGVANGVATLDEFGKIAPGQIPGSVDEIFEYANLAAFPASGSAKRMYVAQDTNRVYRWSGTAYVEISASPGSTDAVPEGSTNQYYSNARVRAAGLSGLSLVTNAAITASDTVLSAFGKLQKQVTDLIASVATKAALSGANFTGAVSSTNDLHANYGADSQVTIGSGMEMGKAGRATAGTPYIDFHSSANNHDYDTRIIASGGTATVGQGSLDIRSAQLQHNGQEILDAGNYTTYTVPKTDASFAGTTKVPIHYVDRVNNVRSGILWYDATYKTWADYVGNAGVANQGPTGNVTPPAGTLVTGWGRRSFIENAAGYGWTFESAAGAAGTGHAVVAEIRASDGAARFGGPLTASLVHLPSGSATSPAYSFTNDRDTGLYSEGDGFLNFAVNGQYVGRFDGAKNFGCQGNFFGGGSGLTGYAANLKAGDTNSVQGAVWAQYTWVAQTFRTTPGNNTYVDHLGYQTQILTEDGGCAAITFHRGGFYAVNFGLDPDGCVSLGGISAGNGFRRFTLNCTNGDFTAQSNIIAYSDERFKTDWQLPPEDFVERWAEIKSGTYRRIDDNLRQQVGVGAQSVQKILPAAVFKQRDNELGLNYMGAAAVASVELAKRAVKQDAEIKELKEQLAAVLQRLTVLEKA